jgi:hypothetical protein
MLFLQHDLPFVTFFIVRCIILSTINARNVFATLTSLIDSTMVLHDWVIFYTKIIFRLFLANKGYMAVMLTVRILINRLRFFEIPRMAGNSINEEFTPERLLMQFLIIKR